MIRRCVRNGWLYEYDDAISGEDWIMGRGFKKIKPMTELELAAVTQAALMTILPEKK